MNSKRTGWLAAVALVCSLIYVGQTSARNSKGTHPSMGPTQSQLTQVPAGQKVKFTGIVLQRGGDTFTFRDQANAEREVLLTASTEVKTHRKGAFRGGKAYGASYILRGLRLEVSGVGNNQGQIVAEDIRFDEDDLRTAQALQARLDPVEELAKANEELAKANKARIEAAEAENKRQAANIEENAAAARKAQAQADEAMKSASLANDRINGLGDYDPIKTITVLFATGSSVLGPKGKAEIDQAAAWVKTQDTKGWVVAVVGFADTTGNTEKNRTLSEKRANAVIGYLVTKHNLPLHRLVQPFGYGENNPVADNKSPDGRAKNRRVEIRLLQNKGISKTS
jgi:OmpA-OmpF porin, OOP family